jgi:hypothetical protein
MAEQMSSREIEDVLSSIRRLVSEDLKPSARTPHPEVKLATPASGGGKLLLTPALRVMAEQSGPTRRIEPRLDALVAALGAAMRPAPAASWESETGDPMPDRLGLGGRMRSERPSMQPGGAATARATAPAWAQPAPDEESEAPAWAQSAPDEVLDYAMDAAEARAPAIDHPAADPEWAEEAEAEVWAELAEDPADDEVDQADDGQDVILNEDMLRDMVRDMIREELAGPLGERITRNIRKLVHAEIARAMTAREFE